MTLAAAQHAKLTELFAEALDLAPDARARLIASIEDRAIADELTALLAVDAKAQGAALITGALAPTVDELPGQRTRSLKVPGYRVLEVLGEGGMGTVYAAEQDEPRRRVAIKVLHARSFNALVRFKTEAQIMARLDHPGIARVLEAGEADGHPFLVMEHIDGQTLDVFAKSHELRERLQLFVQMGDAVHYAHVKGVIHRDLKPSNVMVRSDSDAGMSRTQPGDRAVILDFGVARLADDDGTTPGATRAGELVGTPLYMSPEQARLRADEVDARSDVYTLGVILYELACGKLPYEVGDLPLPAITLVICEDPPIPLGKRDVNLRGDLEAITEKALAKEARDRYQSVAALVEDVRRYLDGLPVSVRTPGTLERAHRFVRRRPLAAAAIAGSVLAGVAFASVVTMLWLDASDARGVAEAARGVAERSREELESRGNQLVLRQARAALDRDPTEAIAWLGTLTARDVDAGTAWAIADEAVARGVARDVMHIHDDEVHWVEATSSGTIVSSGYDGRVFAWTPPSAPLEIAKIANRVHLAIPSPDGKLVAVGGDDGVLVVASIDGATRVELPGHLGDVQALAWSPDGAWLASGDDHGQLYAWPRGAASGRRLTTSKASIGALAFGKTGELVAGDHAGAIWMWNLAAATPEPIRATTTGTDIVTAWSDGKRLASVDVEGVERRWAITPAGLELVRTVSTKQKMKRAYYAPDGEWVALGGVGGVVSYIAGDGSVHELGRHRSQVRSLAVSRDQRWIADGADDGELVLRDRTTDRTHALRGHRGRIRHVEFTHDVRWLVSSDSDGIVRRWDVQALSHGLLEPHGTAIAKLAVSVDGKRLAAVDADGIATVWWLDRGQRKNVGTLSGRITELAIEGTTVVSGSAEGELTWLDGPVPVKRQVEGVVRSIAITRDRVAVATTAGLITLYTLDGTVLPSLVGHDGGSDAVAFDPSGTLLVSGGQDRLVRVWQRDGDSYVQRHALDAGLRGDTHFVQFTHDGTLVVIAGNDGAVVAWRIVNGMVDPASQKVVTRHTGAVTSMSIDPTGHWLVTAGRDATLVRTRIDDGVIGATASVKLPSAAVDLAIDDDGHVHAITRGGSVERWSGATTVTEIDHGVRAGVRIPGGDRYALAFEDGTVILDEHADRSFADLIRTLPSITSFRR